MNKDYTHPGFPSERYATGGAAFPIDLSNKGMSLRDYFAAKALEHVIDQCTTYTRSAEEAYKIADAMLEARK